MSVRVGTSGWSYDSWRGDFYPSDLPARRRLAYLGRRLPSVEINGSFYSLLRPDTYRRYRDETPSGFVFAVKGGRFITHAKKLADAATPLANFLASGVLRLEDKLGPVLWQLPEMAIDADRIARFLDLLPADTAAASRRARRHDRRVSGRASMVVHRSRRLRHALEVRHPAHMSAEIVRRCRDAGTALVISHSGDWPLAEELTAGFAYVRLHGAPDTYASGYGPQDVERWAHRIAAWRDGGEPRDAARITDRVPPRRKHRDVYVYLDNDARGFAPRDALRLADALGVRWEPDAGGR